MISTAVQHPKIAVLRALQLGDLLCAIPAIRALKQYYPESEITLLGLPWAASFVKRFHHYFDNFIHFPGYPGLPEQAFIPSQWDQFVTEMKQQQFDLLLQMQGNGFVVNDFLPELGATALAGFRQPDVKPPKGKFMKYPDGIHEVERHLALMEYLHIPVADTSMEFPVTARDRQLLNELIPLNFNSPYVCIHPGSRAGWRQWPPAYFAMLADHCCMEGFRVVLTGTEDEKPIVAEVMKWMKGDAIDVAGKTDLGMVAALIDHASLLISNCTGVSHIAAATQTPSLVISMDGEPERWGPMNRELHTVIDWLVHPSVKFVFEQLIRKLRTVMQS